MAKKDEEFDNENEIFPVEPRYHPIHKIPRKIYDFLASSKLAMVLLVAILACCVVGVTLFREQKAWELIFTTLWFNALLVLLVVNVACCFFGRIWGRRVTIVSFGMILFHLSFVSMFLGIVYNSLFYFRGNIRLSEGETLPNADPQSYDLINMGRFFSFTHLKGDTTLIRMHRDYKVSGEDKRAAYEVAVGDGPLKKQGIIYITHNLDYRGFTYFPDKEGYSLLTIMADKSGKELYGAVFPLQSLGNKDGSQYYYSTGTKEGPAGMLFPQGELKPLYDLQVAFFPSKLKDRDGEVAFEVRPLPAEGATRAEKPFAAKKVAVGAPFDIGQHLVSVKEIRYWVGMKVSYEPGQPIVLSSLWMGLAGMVISTIGRMRIRKAVA
jgi:cytochrome c biogenesis protein ResB